LSIVTGPAAAGAETRASPLFASTPDAVAVIPTVPADRPVTVQVKDLAVPPGTIAGPAGFGPAASIAAPPVDCQTVAATALAAAWPEFVTFSTNSALSPTHRDAGRKLADADSAAGVCTVTAAVVTGPTDTTAPLLASTPAAVAVKLTTPAAVVVYVHTNVCPVPPANVTGPAGKGPPRVPAAPAATRFAATPVAAAPPVFVTVIVTTTTCPTVTVAGVVTITVPDGEAGVCAVMSCIADAATCIDAQVSPVAVALKM
jgi:hypothetical protein